MTNNSGNSTHIGLIRSISENIVEVGVEAPIACSSCEVSSSCGLSDKEEKIIHIKTFGKDHFVGEKVSLLYKEELSTKALLLVYIIPMLVIVLVLFIASRLTSNELIIGVSALLSLVPYFLLFKLFSKRIDRIFSFSIGKAEDEIQPTLNT